MENSSHNIHKQKRLGAAPIASFEKSFEDNFQALQVSTDFSNLSYMTQGSISTEGMDSAKTLDCKSANANKTTATLENNGKNLQGEKNFNSFIVSTKISTINKKIKESDSSYSTNSSKIGVKETKKPPLLHSKDSIHERPERAPLQNLAPLTPRIDISRASSSSQHEDSRESSPENVFEQVGTGTLQDTVGLGFREEGALDLRTSTEELYFMEVEQKQEEQEKIQQAGKSSITFKYDDQQLYLQQHQRKDSASSEVAALLCISGRTSRVSSVGSQGSAVSRLSAISAVSGTSRSPSPHRMLMETSFCGPKPLENFVESATGNLVGPQIAEILEHVLLSRTKDLTQVVLAEGIQIEKSPEKKKKLNGNPTKKIITYDEISKVEDDNVSVSKNKTLQLKEISSERKDSMKKIIGITSTGTEYIRINLKPNHLYPDQGVAPNEKVVEIANGTTDKPATLKLKNDDEKPKPYSPRHYKHSNLSKDVKINNGSRSPSPAIPGASRKSSFCSLFKTKDSPDSPRDRSRSKSYDRNLPLLQTGTPNKQKSVLAIFKSKRPGTKSKSSSPVEQEELSNLDGSTCVEFNLSSDTQSTNNQEVSRPTSRLRYYDTPPDGKPIHIPLHTPPEEKNPKDILPEITQEAIVKQKEQLRPMSAPTTKSAIINFSFQNNTRRSSTESIDRLSKKLEAVVEHNKSSTVVNKIIINKQHDKTKIIENLNAIHKLSDDINENQRTWSLEVHQHSSQDSQDTVTSENSINSTCKKSKSYLENVLESPVVENGLNENELFNVHSPPMQIISSVAVQQLQQKNDFSDDTKVQQSIINIQQNSDAICKEKKRILFATRLGSGSQEQIFSTQFSLSKTESLSSQLSEQNSIPESPAEIKESLHRSDTVLRRPDDGKKKESVDDTKKDAMHKISITSKDNHLEENNTNLGHFDPLEKRQQIVMRKKEGLSDLRKKDEEADFRHSKYFKSLDVGCLENVLETCLLENLKKKDSDEVINSSTLETPIPTPQVLPPTLVSDQSVTSTDDPANTSESEKDMETDPNCMKKHLPKHLGIVEDHESTGLVSQLSFEDELPYVPTTLPEERPQGVTMIPIKERVNMEVKTFSLDRPRSATPMNPAHLEEYCEIFSPDLEGNQGLVRGEKLRISLPKKNSNSNEKQKNSKSPRKILSTSGKSWFEFAEQGIRSTSGVTTTTSSTILSTITTSGNITQHHFTKDSKNNIDLEKPYNTEQTSQSPPPPLPPRKPSTTSIISGQWINFENIPEKRKLPKRITALPKETLDNNIKSNNIQYNYVKPEECQCECHDSERDHPLQTIEFVETKGSAVLSVDLLKHSSGEDMQPLLDTDTRDSIYRSDSSQDDYIVDSNRLQKIETQKNQKSNSTSNRSSLYSDSNEDKDEYLSKQNHHRSSML